ncbi:hypothetical protein PIB30_086797 [Stylosanthes scabra]|uniref:Uncharacterized protein n=1 Tax=Stylosanthes scabra TaxID=79078 RepID=A0ABU6ZRV1_9FABA|nr:hypothetical protein [Stylosanthes scabra]
MSILNGCGLMLFSSRHKEQIHEDLIRIFYANLQIIDDCILSTMKGTHMKMNLTTFSRIISVPCDRFEYDSSSDAAILKHFGVDTSNEQARDEHVFRKIGEHTFRDEQKQLQHEDDDDRVSGNDSYVHPPITTQATPTSEYGEQLIQLKDYVQQNVVTELGQISNQQQQLRWCLDQNYDHLQYQGRQLDYICRHLGIHVPPPTNIPNCSHDDNLSAPESSQ